MNISKSETGSCTMLGILIPQISLTAVLLLNSQVLDTLDAVLDVGGVYSVESQRFDHHQKGFDEVFGHGFSTKLSSAGLVYKVHIQC